MPHPPPSDNVKISAMPLGCSACRADRINVFSVAEGDNSEITQFGDMDFTNGREMASAEFRQMRLNLIADKALRALRAEH